MSTPELGVRAQRWLMPTWPAFLGACALELIVFAAVDPQQIHLQWAGRELPSPAIYTAAFFVFWLGCYVSGVLTSWLLTTTTPQPVDTTGPSV
jgi:hypothetical protein